MTSDETTGYVHHHLQLAGQSDPLFSDDATALIHESGRGKPRAVSRLALAALIAACAADKNLVDDTSARSRRAWPFHAQTNLSHNDAVMCKISGAQHAASAPRVMLGARRRHKPRGELYPRSSPDRAKFTKGPCRGVSPVSNLLKFLQFPVA